MSYERDLLCVRGLDLPLEPDELDFRWDPLERRLVVPLLVACEDSRTLFNNSSGSSAARAFA
ncbi:MAG: hypothetical protein QOG06_2727 [Gaiellaceae bacterium]|jgi:hypothetical protein|nr:hypothetical protein [Gaiellaceae bacterium]